MFYVLVDLTQLSKPPF